LGGKGLERQPLTVWIQWSQAYDNTPIPTSEGSLYLKDPRSKTLEPICLPQTFDHAPFSCAWIAVMATVFTMSVTVAPRLRSLTGRLSPCMTGPMATALADR